MAEPNTTAAPAAPAPHQLPGQTHPADPKAEALKDPANQLPTSKPANTTARAPSLMGKCEESQFRLREYTVFIPVGHTPNDLSQPNYWMHHAKRLSIHDKVDCISESGEWEATLRVVNKGDTWVKMRLLSFYDAGGRNEMATHPRENYTTDFVPSQKYRVLHKETKAVISQGHPTKDAALAALEAHVETLMKRQ